jgi:hypothetical protein
MKTYTIDTENSITAYATKQDGCEFESFSNQQELASLVAEWPTDRLIEIWNGIPGLAPVKKFTDRKSAVNRIWKAIQSLDGGGAKEADTTATVAPKRVNKANAATKQGKKTNKWIDKGGWIHETRKEAKADVQAKAAALLGKELPDLDWH